MLAPHCRNESCRYVRAKNSLKHFTFSQKSVGFWILELEIPQPVLPQSTNHYQKHRHFRSAVHILFNKSVSLQSCVLIDDIFFPFKIIEIFQNGARRLSPTACQSKSRKRHWIHEFASNIKWWVLNQFLTLRLELSN